MKVFSRRILFTVGDNTMWRLFIYTSGAFLFNDVTSSLRTSPFLSKDSRAVLERHPCSSFFGYFNDNYFQSCLIRRLIFRFVLVNNISINCEQSDWPIKWFCNYSKGNIDVSIRMWISLSVSLTLLRRNEFVSCYYISKKGNNCQWVILIINTSLIYRIFTTETRSRF